MQGMPNMQGVRGGPGGPQQAMAGNMPPGAMNANAMGMNNVIGPQQGNAAGQMQGNMVNQMNQMGGQMPMNVQSMPPNQINQMGNQMGKLFSQAVWAVFYEDDDD